MHKDSLHITREAQGGNQGPVLIKLLLLSVNQIRHEFREPHTMAAVWNALGRHTLAVLLYYLDSKALLEVGGRGVIHLKLVPEG